MPDLLTCFCLQIPWRLYCTITASLGASNTSVSLAVLALVRAGNLQESAWVLNTYVEASINPSFLSVELPPAAPFPIYPHRFLSNPMLFSGPGIATAVGVAAQSQIADFFVSGGATIPNPNQYTGPYSGAPLFQPFSALPASLLDGLNFIQITP